MAGIIIAILIIISIIIGRNVTQYTGLLGKLMAIIR